MPAYSTDKGFTGSTKDKDKNKSTSTGAGTKALASGSGAQTQPRDPAGPGGATSGGSGAGPGMKAYSTRADRGGGTTTSDQYSPGAVENHPLANPAAVLDMLSGAVPIYGSANLAYKGMKALNGDPDPNTGLLGDLTGADPGPQRGWQPDRYKGVAQKTGLGAAAGDSSGERDIPGQSYNRNVAALTGDLTTDPITGGDVWRDDVVLMDRRKPYAQQTDEQKRKALLAMTF